MPLCYVTTGQDVYSISAEPPSALPVQRVD